MRYANFPSMVIVVALVCILITTYRLGHLKLEMVTTKDKTLYKSFLAGNYNSNWDFMYIDDIKRDCGELCDTERPGVPGPYFDQVTAKIDCHALFENSYVDNGHGKVHAPREIPKELLSYYSMNGRLKVWYRYHDQPNLGRKIPTPVWTKEAIDKQISLAREGKLRGTYNVGEVNAVRDGLAHAPNIQNGRILVIGSLKPWVEACCLEAGAREVVTLEYGEIISKHPKVKTIVPRDFRQSYLNGTMGTFDGIVTFSSVEHSGLGRYGDALNPWGDIIAIARGWCVTKVNGSLTIGVMYKNNKDYNIIEFNAHRVYGKVRYPYLTTNWRQHYRGVGSQRVFVSNRYHSVDVYFETKYPSRPMT